ncbi:tetratricopeptide (TPR) repeat protein [Oxalobacteraceae bacterium GrIS 2.11]
MCKYFLCVDRVTRYRYGYVDLSNLKINLETAMAWRKFPYPDPSYIYSADSLKKNWKRLHTGDAEKCPDSAPLLAAWSAFHAGDFEHACTAGLKLGMDGYTVANKATCIYANYLEQERERKIRLFEDVSERCVEQQKACPKLASGYYWQAYALGRYAQEISVLAALAQGIASKIKHCLDMAIRLEPKHADAYIARGVYNAEIIDKVGAVIGGLTYDVKESDGIAMFRHALELNPDSAIARIEYANGLVMLKGKNKMAEALTLYREAAAMKPMDAMERLDVQLALEELE